MNRYLRVAMALLALVLPAVARAQGIAVITTPTKPVSSAAAEGSHVLKAASGGLLGLSVTTGAASGFVMLFDATSAPADGAVTPAFCYVVPANSTVSVGYLPPASFGTGIVSVFSTTGCFTKTASATAFFAGTVQ